MNRAIFLFCFNFLLVSSYAQMNVDSIVYLYNSKIIDQTKEYAFVNLEKTIHFSGNILNFQIDILKNGFRPTDLSKVAYLDLINSSSVSVAKKAVRLDNGYAKGSINIPIDLETGNYQLIVYTNYMRNFELKEFSHRVPVYIQNVFDNKPKRVLKSAILTTGNNYIKFSTTQQKDNNLSLDIADSIIFITIDRQALEGQHFLLSEGLGGLQFVAPINDSSDKVSTFKVSRKNFNGNFQKLILLSQNQEVVATLDFLLGSMSEVDNFKSKNINHNDIHILKSKIIDGDEPVSQNEMLAQLFKIFFNLQKDNSLTSNAILSTISNNELTFINNTGTALYWHKALNSSYDNVNAHPIEQLPSLSIQVNGKLNKYKNPSYSIHFFKSGLNMLEPIISDKMSIPIDFPVGNDVYHVSIIDAYNDNITDKLKPNISSSYPEFTFENSDSYFNENITNPYIKGELEFYYAISTFGQKNDFKNNWYDIDSGNKYYPKDYTGLVSFEDFIREAVPNLTVSKNKQGDKILNIYHHVSGKFGKPQLTILNGRAIDTTQNLFEMELEDILYVQTITNDEDLIGINPFFGRGILIIQTVTNPKLKVLKPDPYLANILAFDNISEDTGFSNSFFFDLNKKRNEVQYKSRKNDKQIIEYVIDSNGFILKTN